MKTTFDYQYNHNCNCVVCTRELFHNACKSANVANRIRRFRDSGDAEAKRGLPAVCWQAHYKEGKRLNKDAVFSGLFQLDIDHVEAPRELFDSWTATKDFDELGIYLVFVTPSGHGLKVVAQMRPRAGVPNTISAHQRWLSEQLGLAEFDACTKDLARMAFVPLAEDILYENPELWDCEQIVEQLEPAPSPRSARNPLSFSPEGTPKEGGSAGHSILISDYDNDVTVKGNFTIDGRPMVDYVLGWFAANGGYPQQGQRNNTIYRCALYFRNFTDFSPQMLADNIPSFGLSDAEMLQVCSSACSAQRSKFWPRDIAELLEPEDADDSQGEEETLNDDPPEMPPLIQLFVSKSDPRFRAATVLAMLPVLGGLATDLRMVFPDGEEHSPSFMSVIIAPQASGKSFARRIWRHLTERLHEEDAVAWEQERIWRETLRDSMRDIKKIDGASKDPEVVIRLVPSKITEPQFFKRLHNSKGKHLIGFYEEIDSLTKEAKGASYDDKRDLFREAFDNAEHGRDVANVESFSGMERIFYNFLALGTPNSVMRFYNNAEDGLVSRTIFYQLPVGVFDSMPRHLPITLTEADQIRRSCDYLIDLRQKQPEMVDAQGKVALPTGDYIDPIWQQWREMAELRALKNGSDAEGILLKRASVIAWRACCIYWLLWGLQCDEATMRKLKDAFFWTADIVLREQVALFGRQLDAVQTTRKKGKPKSLFDMLPNTFTYKDVRHIIGDSTSMSNIYARVNYWKQHGLITKIGSNFEKL